MTPFLALQVQWVGFALSDDEFIALADKIGQGKMAREQVEIYRTQYAGRRH